MACGGGGRSSSSSAMRMWISAQLEAAAVLRTSRVGRRQRGARSRHRCCMPTLVRSFVFNTARAHHSRAPSRQKGHSLEFPRPLQRPPPPFQLFYLSNGIPTSTRYQYQVPVPGPSQCILTVTLYTVFIQMGCFICSRMHTVYSHLLSTSAARWHTRYAPDLPTRVDLSCVPTRSPVRSYSESSDV